ncbi:hypothetical protein WR164_03250 [Philodulcilactobacillus myokoensis]|uniref:Uncharacterized protein n=1 Tax=Philodulcilactobacillus myokoensis TaxID=2929573 RepID=A0A9W6B050_9LACO|nr:hypothetical protein [Philodulcilactobacillus myokoensis]GLB46346.1 hypothetical protein WR164_03250 [Philodulcilactobacillus myokoensis]
MLTKNDFTNFDSVAIWEPQNSVNNFDNLNDEEKVKCFKTKNTVKKLDGSSIKTMIHGMKKDRIIVGKNPGDKGKDIDNHTLLAFHIQGKSNDASLAAALYNTNFWGAFMTDLNHEYNSNSSNVKAKILDVEHLFDRLKQLNITTNNNDDIKFIAIGNDAFNTFKDYFNELKNHNHNNKINVISDRQFEFNDNNNHYLITRIPDYSGNNQGPRENDWNLTKVNKIIKSIK